MDKLERIHHRTKKYSNAATGDILFLLRELKDLGDAVDELLEVADHRGDNQLPTPEDDPLLWSARMQDAWDELARLRKSAESTQ